MIKEVIDVLIAGMPASVSAIKKADRYRGEFEEGSDWNPTFPIVLFRVEELKTDTLLADGVYARKTLEGTVYCGNDYEAAELMESVVDYLNGTMIELDNINYSVSTDGGSLHGWFGRVEVYKVGFTVS